MNKKGYSLILITVFLFSMTSLGCLGSPDIQVESINSKPSKITPKNQVTINVDVNNFGDKKGSKEIKLNINDNIKSKMVELEPDQSKTLSFKYTPQEVGNYNISIGNKFETLKVLEPAKFSVKFAQQEEIDLSKESDIMDFNITNIGGIKDTKQMNLSINGEVKAQKTVTLAPNQSKIISFDTNYSIYDEIEDYNSVNSISSELHYIEVDDKITYELVDMKETRSTGESYGVTEEEAKKALDYLDWLKENGLTTGKGYLTKSSLNGSKDLYFFDFISTFDSSYEVSNSNWQGFLQYGVAVGLSSRSFDGSYVNVIVLNENKNSIKTFQANHELYKNTENNVNVEYASNVDSKYAKRLANYGNLSDIGLILSKDNQGRYKVGMMTIYESTNEISSTSKIYFQNLANNLSKEVFNGETVILNVLGTKYNILKTYLG